jgi:tRNA A37 threonylcarbamoyladenosine synthetase subunit TsaC/SUA5/YrdC
MYLSRFDRLVDLIADTEQPLQAMETTMLDLTGDTPVLMREGLGMEKLTEILALEGLELT